MVTALALRECVFLVATHISGFDRLRRMATGVE
jgi:hypothetical protein